MSMTETSLSQRIHKLNPAWAAVERAYLAMHPACAVCGIVGPVIAHHIVPVAYCHALGRPDLELDARNLITLCQSRPDAICDDHHLYVGHLGDFHSFNLRVREDAAGRFKQSLKARLWFSVERIRSLKETLAAYPHLRYMTEPQRLELRALVDDLFPLRPGN